MTLIAAGPDVAKILELAAGMTRPLAIGAFCSALLFLVLRQIIAKNIFPRLTTANGADLLRLIVERLFLLSLVAVVLSFGAYLAVSLFGGVPPPPNADGLIEAAHEITDALYVKDHERIHKLLTGPLRAQYSYKDTRTLGEHETFQYGKGPVARRVSGEPKQVSGLWFVMFESELDQRSRFREGLLLAREPEGWRLQNYKAEPSTWPMNSALVNFIPHTTVAALHAEGTGAGIDSWISPLGWQLEVLGQGPQVADRTCDLRTIDPASKVEVRLIATAGGCDRVNGEHLLVYGKISAHSDRAIDVAEARIYPRV